jgi:hypothetical protein
MNQILVAMIVVCCFACAAQAAPLAAGAEPASQTQHVTFAQHIAPLLYSQCVACHREGEAAPFPLLSYQDARKHARQIADVTARRVMPPWKAAVSQHAGGGVADFVGARRLSDDQIALLGRWVDQGCPEGDADSAPAPPTFTTGWRLGEPDIVLEMVEPYALVSEGRDVYRCFVLPVSIPQGKYIRAVEYRPGNRRIVHHALITSLPRMMSILRLAGGDDGGRSFSSGLVPPGERLPGQLGIWTPGMDPRPLPDSIGSFEWPTGSDLVLQLHLHPSGKAETERSSVGIYLTDRKPTARFRSFVMLDKKLDIAPGEATHAVHMSRTLPFPSDVYGVFPHMHLIGRTVRVTATLPDGTVTPIITIGDWDFNWQNYYQYARPLPLPAGTRLDSDWTFDNSAANPANPSSPPRRVTFGEQTTDEMAALILDLVPTGPAVKGTKR